MEARKAKVEGIFPLSFLQKALLFHSLQEENDQGFLQVESTLSGNLNLENFKKAWEKTVERHESLRTSIHWVNIEKPVQVIHKKVKLPFTFYDWSENSEKENQTKFEKLKKSESVEKLNLSKAPVIRVFVIKLTESKHLLLWSCHHILADGWSATIILKDLFGFYEAISNSKETADLPEIPSYKSYLNWIKKQEKTEAETFWTKTLDNFTTPTLVGRKTKSKGNFKIKAIRLNKTQSEQIKVFSQKSKVTQNTLIQGFWAILLSKFVKCNDVAFGTIASGRSIDLQNADLMVGMFMKVLPFRITLDSNEKFSDWLKDLQVKQAKIRNYEYTDLDEIQNLKGDIQSSTLFDSLVVFENMPMGNLNAAGISLKEFKSGLTSNYPLTLAVKPTENIEFYIKYDSNSISKESINWWIENLQNILESVNELNNISLESLSKLISNHTIFIESKKDNKEEIAQIEHNYVAPKNKVELELVKIWEELFDQKLIGINDNFFELGGTSMIAVRMFAKIERALNRNLSPTILLKYQTIEKIAQQIQESTSEKSWKSIVPIRATGNKTPVFCIHGGGGHVLYYKTLVDNLDENQPVYGIQPIGLGGVEKPHESVEEMSTHYLNEIKKIVPNGPYNFVGYCFSNAVCIEMARQLKANGEKNINIIIIDSDPMYMKIDKSLLPNYFERVVGYGKLILGRNRKELSYRIRRKLRRFNVKVNPFATKAIDLENEDLESAENNQEKYFLKTLEHLKSAYIKYEWKPFDEDVKIILAGSFETHPWAKVVIKQWDSLSKGGVEYVFISGTHSTLFEEPEVLELAKHLQIFLDKGISDEMETSSE